MVEGGGFEPPKAEPADLQSAPFDRSGTPPIKPVMVAQKDQARQDPERTTRRCAPQRATCPESLFKKPIGEGLSH